MSQEAPPTVDDGSDDGHGESDGRGGAHERRGQAEEEERPHLRKEDEEAENVSESEQKLDTCESPIVD